MGETVDRSARDEVSVCVIQDDPTWMVFQRQSPVRLTQVSVGHLSVHLQYLIMTSHHLLALLNYEPRQHVQHTYTCTRTTRWVELKGQGTQLANRRVGVV